MQKFSSKLVKIFVSMLLGIFLVLPLSADLPVSASPLIPKTKIEKKSELKKVFSKFLKAMVLVCGSGIVLFVLLYAYKRMKNKSTVSNSVGDIEKNLNTPETIDDATKFVIEKF